MEVMILGGPHGLECNDVIIYVVLLMVFALRARLSHQDKFVLNTH